MSTSRYLPILITFSAGTTVLFSTALAQEEASNPKVASLEAIFAKKKSTQDFAKDVCSDAAMQKSLLQWQMYQLAIDTEAQLIKARDKRKADLEKTKAQHAAAKKNPAISKRALKKIQQNLQSLRSHLALPVRFWDFSEKDAASLASLMEDASWMEAMLYSGESVPIVRAVSIFLAIAEKDSEVMKAGRVRDIAVAAALEFARFDGDREVACARALYFIENWRKGYMNKSMDGITLSQMRVLLGTHCKSERASIASLQWALDHAHLPDHLYTGACWRAQYRLNNIYGDSIHVNYHETYSEEYDNNFPRMIYETGGVCGALSHLGALCAIGNGVPATTMGEPGHCAYTVLVGDKWTPAYSLSWKRGLHWQPWAGIHFFSSLQHLYDIYAPQQAMQTRESRFLESMALALEGLDTKRADEFYQEAIKKQPLSYSAWRSYLAFLAKDSSKQARISAVQQLQTGLAAQYPEMAVHLLKNQAMALLKDLDAAERRAIALQFWKSAKGMGPAPWGVADFLDTQTKWMNEGREDTRSSMLGFYGELLSALSQKVDLMPVAITWGSGWGAKQDVATKAALAQTMVGTLSKAQGGDVSMKDVIAKAILSAGKLGDIDSFQALQAMVPEKDRHIKNMPKIKPFAGELLSKGGLIYASSTCRHDSPSMHAGVLDPRGGHFHTDKEKNPYVVVKLPRTASLSGLVIVGRAGKDERMRNIKVQVSETGAEGSWIDVHDFGPDAPPRVMRVNLEDKMPKALYIRIQRGGEANFFHLNGIYVYGDRAA